MSRKAPRSTRRSFGRLRQFRSGRWKASYTGPDGRLYEAPSTFSAKVDAEAWLTDRRREIDRELWSPPATEAQKTVKRKAETRLREYADVWVENRTVKGRPLRPRTKAHYRKLLDDHIYPTFGNKPLRDITVASVNSWHAKTLATRPTLRAHAYSLLSTILDTARSPDQLIESNPCAIRGAGTTERKIKPKPATLDELAIIIEEMPDEYRAMIVLASWCALRFGELIELRRKDIDLKTQVVRVERGVVRVGGSQQEGPPKSDAGQRDVSIPPHVLPVVKRHLAKYVSKQPDSLLFPAKSGGWLQPSTLQRHYSRARLKAQRPDLRFHDLRTTGAVLAAQAGATLAELMERLGHSTPQAAMKYQHAAAGRDRANAKRMSELATRRDTPE